MTAADKRKTIAAIRKVAKWMSDPRHRVKDWGKLDERDENGRVCKTCIAGAFTHIAHMNGTPKLVVYVAERMKFAAFIQPWTTAELRKLFRESIKAVEESE